MTNVVQLADNLTALGSIPADSVPLIYIDPPFNTGGQRTRVGISSQRSLDGDRTGFGGHRYLSVQTSRQSYADRFDDYLSFLEPRLREGHRVLAATGSFYLHLDQRELHYVKIVMDEIFGRESFINEIIWAYAYGGRATRRWP